jgi:predicted permease
MRDLRFALRMLVKSPFVTAIAILSLGLGIGANTAIYSLFNQVLLQPLPVHAPDRLVNLSSAGPKSGSTSNNQSGDSDSVFSYPMFRDLERDQDVFESLGGHRLIGANIGYQGETLPEDGIEVSSGFFTTLGITPAAGRFFGPAEDRIPGEAKVAVLSHGYWTSRFKQDASILGQSIIVNGTPLSVIGIAPRGFEGPTKGTKPKVYVPITLRGLMEPGFNDFDNRRDYWVYVFARLKPGVTMAQAAAGINGKYTALINQVDVPLQTGMTPQNLAQFKAKTIQLADGRQGQSRLMRSERTPLTILMSVTGVVLLIACANIANLLLARGAGRAGEMAVRLSIGASRKQLVRQLLLESCLLSLFGGLAGLVVMKGTVAFLVSQVPTVSTMSTAFSWGVLGFAAGLSLLTGVLFGLFPALHSTRPDLANTLKSQAGQPSGAKSAARFRAVLVTVQIALSMGLLTCAGLFTKSLLNVSRVQLGVTVDELVTFSVNPRRLGYPQPRLRQFLEDLGDRLAAVPGVVNVAIARVPLIGNASSSTTISIEGYSASPTAGDANSAFNEITPGYFTTTGMSLLAGRDFSAADTLGAPKVAIVNESFAKTYKLGANPVGRRFARGSSTTYDFEIVGLVRDAKYNQVRSDVRPVFFLPYRQSETLSVMTVYLKTAGAERAVIDQVRPVVASLDSNLPVINLRTMTQQVAANTAQDRLSTVLSTSFATIATLLAAIGLYGVLAFTVSQRTREFGLRMALGAAPGNVRGLVLKHVMWMTLIGGTIGLGTAIYVGRLASAQLFQLTSYDPVVLSSSALLLAIVAMAAGFVPALRASRVDPMKALRQQ